MSTLLLRESLYCKNERNKRDKNAFASLAKVEILLAFFYLCGIADNPMFQSSSYWSIYKFSHPTKASEIESIVDLPLNDYSKTDIQELVGSITRLSYRYECPIKQLRESIFYSMNPGVEWNPAILELVRDAKMSVEVPKEADEFGIKKENTS